MYVSHQELIRLADARGCVLRQITPTLHRDPQLRKKGYLSDDSLYEALGFSESCRVDQSAYEDSDATAV